MAEREAVIGMKAWLDSMEGLTYSQQKNVFARCLRKAAQLIADAMRRFSPDDPKTIGSRVGKSISVAVRDQSAVSAYAEIGPTNPGFAAIFAELGTKNQPARPFIGPAYDQSIQSALELFDEEMGMAIEREFTKRK